MTRLEHFKAENAKKKRRGRQVEVGPSIVTVRWRQVLELVVKMDGRYLFE